MFWKAFPILWSWINIPGLARGKLRLCASLPTWTSPLTGRSDQGKLLLFKPLSPENIKQELVCSSFWPHWKVESQICLHWFQVKTCECNRNWFWEIDHIPGFGNERKTGFQIMLFSRFGKRAPGGEARRYLSDLDQAYTGHVRPRWAFFFRHSLLSSPIQDGFMSLFQVRETCRWWARGKLLNIHLLRNYGRSDHRVASAGWSEQAADGINGVIWIQNNLIKLLIEHLSGADVKLDERDHHNVEFTNYIFTQCK
jgi:hypothetical protein